MLTLSHKSIVLEIYEKNKLSKVLQEMRMYFYKQKGLDIKIQNLEICQLVCLPFFTANTSHHLLHFPSLSLYFLLSLNFPVCICFLLSQNDIIKNILITEIIFFVVSLFCIVKNSYKKKIVL